jgi:enamine deaminase RidA (YjgF/YER057c/UK114 family)
MTHRVLQPADWLRPKGYANGIAAAQGRLVFIAGQIGWDAAQRIPDAELAPQVQLALENIVRILAEAGGRPEHIVRLTWYLKSRDEYLRDQQEIGAAYRTVMGRHFPTMTVLQVVELVDAGAKVEIEATAVVPDA